MTQEKIENLLANHEKITVEYKESKNEIPDNVYETVSSFSNRYGGYIILGVDDDGVPIGMNRKAVQSMKNNFINQLNNPNKMSPTLYIPLEEFEIDGNVVLACFVPSSSTVVKCKGRIMIETKMVIMILQIPLFRLKTCMREKSAHLMNIKYFHM